MIRWFTDLECSTDSEVNQRLSRTMEPCGEWQITLDPHGELTADHFGSPWQPGDAEKEGERGESTHERQENRNRDRRWTKESGGGTAVRRTQMP